MSLFSTYTFISISQMEKLRQSQFKSYNMFIFQVRGLRSGVNKSIAMVKTGMWWSLIWGPGILFQKPAILYCSFLCDYPQCSLCLNISPTFCAQHYNARSFSLSPSIPMYWHPHCSWCVPANNASGSVF